MCKSTFHAKLWDSRTLPRFFFFHLSNSVQNRKKPTADLWYRKCKVLNTMSLNVTLQVLRVRSYRRAISLSPSDNYTTRQWASYCLKSMVPRVGGRLKTEGLTVTNVPGSLVSIFQTWAGKGEKKNILALTLFNSLRDEGLLSEGTSWTWHQRPLPRGTHGQTSGEKARDTVCGMGAGRKGLSKERSSCDEGK